MINLLKPDPIYRNGYKDKRRLVKVRALPCIICSNKGRKQESKTEVHHFIGKGLGLKASDLLTIPLCNFHHTGSYTSPIKGQAIHSGLKAFEDKFGTQEELLEKVNKMLNND